MQVLGLIPFCFIYINDILIANNTKAEHLKHVWTVFHDQGKVGSGKEICDFPKSPGGQARNPPAPITCLRPQEVPSASHAPKHTKVYGVIELLLLILSRFIGETKTTD